MQVSSSSSEGARVAILVVALYRVEFELSGEMARHDKDREKDVTSTIYDCRAGGQMQESGIDY